MKLWLDTANIDEIREINAWGVLAGVTTNPTLAGKEGVPFEQRLKEIAAEVDGPVCGEVISTEREGMVAEGLKLVDIAPNIVVKAPVTPDGYAAVAELSKRGIKTNMTLCFSPTQAILAAEAGATYISPFLGRVDDIGNDGINLLSEIVEIYRVQGYTTYVLAASLRSPQHVVDSAKVGADVATLPHSVFKALVKHPLTDIGLKRFLDDWEAYQRALA
ncbi:MAG TPA: fructose-6-phosphate aldolase [Actinomycetota bacterium]|jgi:transaldolase|nr:fructose-6-phosphate aldolase [Actinomycetota bacterium]